MAKFGAVAGYFYTINTVIGAGILALPWAYMKSGWLYWIVFQCFYGLINLLLSFQFLAVLARIKLIQNITPQNPFKGIKRLKVPDDSTTGIAERRSDVNEITLNLFGKAAQGLVTIMISVKNWLGLAAYCIIFATSFASNVPFFGMSTWIIYETGDSQCRLVYSIYVIIFGVSMIYFSTRDLKEQMWMQMSMAVMRFIVVSLIIATSLSAILTNTYIDSDDFNPVSPPPAINPIHTGSSVPIIAYAVLLGVTLPTIIEHMEDKGTVLLRMVVWVVVSMTIMYILVGIVVPLASQDLQSNLTINYIGYSAGGDERVWWTYLLEYIIILFPAFDVASIFPIGIIITSDNQIALFYGSKSKQELKKSVFYGFRIFCVSVPVIIALMFYDLGQVESFSGLIELVFQWLISLMFITTKKLMPIPTDFDIGDSLGLAWGLIGINFIGFWFFFGFKLYEVIVL